MRPCGVATAREWEVVDLLYQGQTTDEIAEALVLSHETVRSHIKNLMRKLGAKTRAEAVALAHKTRGGDRRFDEPSGRQREVEAVAARRARRRSGRRAARRSGGRSRGRGRHPAPLRSLRPRWNGSKIRRLSSGGIVWPSLDRDPPRRCSRDASTTISLPVRGCT